MRKIVFIILFKWIGLAVYAQVYNYIPFHYSNFETNPSYLSVENAFRIVSYQHGGSTFLSKRFSYDNFKGSIYIPRYFSGLGVAFNNTSINDSLNYKTLSLGYSYRIVLFNNVFTRIGVLHKFSLVESSEGFFDYYNFNALSENKSKRKFVQTDNFSLSFSSGRDKYYLSLSALNLQLSNANDKRFFPKYYVICIGDLGKIVDRRNLDISFTGVLKQNPESSKWLKSYYLNYVYLSYSITREASLRFGLRAGYCDDKYFHYSPMIAFYKMKSNKLFGRKFFIVQLLFDSNIHSKNSIKPFRSNYQINITKMF